MSSCDSPRKATCRRGAATLCLSATTRNICAQTVVITACFHDSIHTRQLPMHTCAHIHTHTVCGIFIGSGLLSRCQPQQIETWGWWLFIGRVSSACYCLPTRYLESHPALSQDEEQYLQTLQDTSWLRAPAAHTACRGGLHFLCQQWIVGRGGDKGSGDSLSSWENVSEVQRLETL